MLRSFTTVGGFTFLSRILGYIRELLIASTLGAGPLSDAFFLALRLPNLFRRLFAEGAFNAAFVPIFSALYHKKDFSKAHYFAKNALSYLCIILFFLVLFFEIFMPFLMRLIAPGFYANTEKFYLTVTFARIMFPYILFISIAAFFGSILNALHKFASAAFAPALLNANAILALLFFATSPYQSANALTWSIPISGILQLIWVATTAYIHKFSFVFTFPRITPEIRLLFKRMLPGIVGAGVYQFNMLISDIVASFIPSGISYLAFADRINQFPLSIIGVAIGTVLLPLLSTQLNQKKEKEAQLIQNKALHLALFLSLPAAAALFIFSKLVIYVLYQHGRFTAEATLATSYCLSAFVTGLPAYVCIKALSTNFFARGDTSTPVKVALIAVLSNIALNIILVQFWSYLGVAIATSVSAWINVCILAFLLYQRHLLTLNKALFMPIIKTCFAVFIMSLTLISLQNYLQKWIQEFPITFLAALSMCGGSIYIIIAFSIKTLNLKEIQKLS